MGVGAWLGSNTKIGDLMSELGRVARLHETENLCHVVARRARHSLG